MAGDRKTRHPGRWRRIVLLILLVAVLAGSVWLFARTPSLDRDWSEEVSRLPDAAYRQDGTVLISNVRHWNYDADGPVDNAWRDASYDPQRLAGLWFNLDPLPVWDGVAHTFLVFEFDGGSQRYLGVSVEARKTRGQVYSGLKGLFRQYELLHVWASEADLLKRRTLYLGEDVYQYRLALTREQIRAIFDAFVEQTQALAQQPRFYNTLLSNCTNELARTIRRTGGEIPWHYSYVLTGFADRYLHGLGYIAPGESEFGAVRRAALKTGRIVEFADLTGAEFSDAIRRLR